MSIALAILVTVGSLLEESYAGADNFFNLTQNFAFIGIMALGMTPVIITETGLCDSLTL